MPQDEPTDTRLTPAEAVARAETYLARMETRDLDAARGFLHPQARLIFPGGRVLTGIDGIVGNSGRRYRVVRKRIDRREGWPAGGRIHVLISGTLYGEWPDGTAFEGIRFIDLFAFEDGRIVTQEVWNDTGEHLAARAAAQPAP